MRITVQMFAAAREIAGAGDVVIETPPTATVSDLRSALSEAHPQMASLMKHALFAVDGKYVDDQAAVVEASEVACIPPVSGG